MVATFQEIVWNYYREHGRDLPWRADGLGAYEIMVSELMLQQTQVNRVLPKYKSFMRDFPTISALAAAPLSAVLTAWQGLGYNRRAKYLHEAARALADIAEPWGFEAMVACKGIGPNTAAAIVVYAYDQPRAFVETNIRTVLIHHFFSDKTTVDDKELMAAMEAVMDRERPREFGWALMDYGTYLKATEGNLSRKSKHYTKQSPFDGSKRQLRGEIVRRLSKGVSLDDMEDSRLQNVLNELIAERLITKSAHGYRLHDA